MSPGRLRDRLVAERMGFRVQEASGEIDPRTGRLVFTHGPKDFKESEACICERGLFRLLPGTDGGNAWEEVPHCSRATDPSMVEECLAWLRAQPGVRPRLEWRAWARRWKCCAEVAGRPPQQWPRATLAIVGEAVTAVLLQVARGQTANLGSD